MGSDTFDPAGYPVRDKVDPDRSDGGGQCTAGGKRGEFPVI